MQVTVIDRNPQRRSGCSFGNAGMLVPSHIVPLAAPGMIRLGLKWMWNSQSPFYIQPRPSWELFRWLWKFQKHCTSKHVQRSAPVLRDMHFRGRELYESLESELPGGFGLTRNGLLVLCKTQAGLDEEAVNAEQANRFNVPAIVLDRDATAQMDPDVTMDVVGSIYYPQDCHLSPERLMSTLETTLIENGCTFYWDSEATGFVTHSDNVDAVRLRDNQIDVDELVLCGGVWTAAIGEQLRLAMPMQAGKGYSVTLDKPAELPRLCSLLHEARVALTPMGESLRVGGTMEMAGLDESVTDSRVRGIIDSVANYFPALNSSDFADLKAWHGLRPCAPDGMPYLGRPRRWKNVTVSTGHAMMGISLATASGEWVADLMEGQSPRIDGGELLSPDRFARV